MDEFEYILSLTYIDIHMYIFSRYVNFQICIQFTFMIAKISFIFSSFHRNSHANLYNEENMHFKCFQMCYFESRMKASNSWEVFKSRSLERIVKNSPWGMNWIVFNTEDIFFSTYRQKLPSITSSHPQVDISQWREIIESILQEQGWEKLHLQELQYLYNFSNQKLLQSKQ